jgi:hypothetical protein
MKKLALLLASFAFAPAGFAADQAGSTKDPMAGWVPRKVTAEQKDKKEIAALFKAMHEAGKAGDLNAAAALVDFPVLMVTDDSKGEASAESWTKEHWMEVMAPFYKPMPGMKMTDKPTIFLLTDSLASVDNQWTMTMGNKKTTGRSASLLVRKDGQWRIKSMAEGGWGDMMKEKPASASQPTEPSGSGMGTGTGTSAPAAPEQPPSGSTTETPGTGSPPTK